MKKLLSAVLAAIFICMALMLTACKEEEAPKGPSVVDYGETTYIAYTEDPNFTFEYLDCFIRSSEEGSTFVANTKDDKGVLMFYEEALDESRTYKRIAAYSDDEVKNMLTIALGIVPSLGAETVTDAFVFENKGDYLYMSMEITATYEETGEVQYISIVKYILPDDTAYTVHAFVPMSCVEQYGDPFINVQYAG